MLIKSKQNQTVSFTMKLSLLNASSVATYYFQSFPPPAFAQSLCVCVCV